MAQRSMRAALARLGIGASLVALTTAFASGTAIAQVTAPPPQDDTTQPAAPVDRGEVIIVTGYRESLPFRDPISCGGSQAMAGGVFAGFGTTSFSTNPFNLDPYDYYNNPASPGYGGLAAVTAANGMFFRDAFIGRPATRLLDAHLDGTGAADYLSLSNTDWRSATDASYFTTTFQQMSLAINQDFTEAFRGSLLYGRSRSTHDNDGQLVEFNRMDNQGATTWDARGGGSMPEINYGFDVAKINALIQTQRNANSQAYITSGQAFNIRTFQDAPGGTIEGFEIDYQQDFTFLPDFWSNFGIQANYTHIDSTLHYIVDPGSTVTPIRPVVIQEGPWTGASPDAFKATLYYESDIFSGRLWASYRDEYITTYPIASGACDPSFCDSPLVNDFIGSEPTFNLDANFTYTINDDLTASVETLNLTNQADERWMYETSRIVTQYQSTGRQIFIGLRAKY